MSPGIQRESEQPRDPQNNGSNAFGSNALAEWRNGRRWGLKIPCPLGCVGSNPTSATFFGCVTARDRTQTIERSLPAITWLLLTLLYSAGVAAPFVESPGPWPQWRGPKGLGVSADSDLPEVWSDDSANIAWKAKIPGEGHSSPIVSHGKVFLTTAFEDSRAVISHRIVVATLCILATFFMAGASARLILGRRKKNPGDAKKRGSFLEQILHPVIAIGSAAVFLLFATLLLVFPEQYDATIGKFLANTLGNYDTEHLFYMTNDTGAARWLNTGAVALLGFATSLHWLRARSIWRVVGVLAFAMLAVVFVASTPADLWKYRLPLCPRLLFVIPGSLVAAWFLLGYFDIRLQERAPEAKSGLLQSLNRVTIRLQHEHMVRLGGGLATCLFAALAGMALLVFVPVNLLLPQIGLQRAVVCVDFESGEILWQNSVFVAPTERKHRDNSYATPTPATDGRYVVANFGAAVVCLDVDGHMIWKVQDPTYTDDTRYGAASSVLFWEDKAIVLQEREENTKRLTWMAAFDKDSGEICWNVHPQNLVWAYTTGLLYDDGAGMKLITASHENIACFEVDSGQLVWEYEIVLDQLVASMVRLDSLFFIGGGTWGPSALIALQLSGSGEETEIEELWQTSEDTPGCASPVAYDGMVFTITDTGVMCCYNAVSGQQHWRERLKGRYLASLIAGDGKVYASNTHGLTTVVAADPQFQVLSRNPLKGDCRASLAVAESHILIRTSEFLYRIGKKKP